MKNNYPKNTLIITITALSMILLVSCNGVSDKNISKMDTKKVASMEKKDPTSYNKIEPTETIYMNNKSDMIEKTNTNIQENYIDYSEEKLTELDGNIVLFFHADWCPACIAADKEITVGEMPIDLTILKVNYDNSSELKKKYGVLTQTTFVQIDNQGNLINKWVGSRDLEDIINKLK